MKKGFTLIELLIVIAIVGILAVAFLPSLLKAPIKARDTTRRADLQRIQKVIIDFFALSGSWNPDATSLCIVTIPGDPAPWLVAFGGKIPRDPKETNTFPNPPFFMPDASDCVGAYFFQGIPGPYSFGLYAHMELIENANTKCTTAFAGTIEAPDSNDPDDWCYVIFTKL